RRAALAVGRSQRLARGRQAELVGVRIGVVDVPDDRLLQVLRRAETERARVADVELDQLASCRLEGMGSPVALAADLVADFRQALAHGKRFFGGRHGRAQGGGSGSCMVSEISACGASGTGPAVSPETKRDGACRVQTVTRDRMHTGPTLSRPGRALQCARWISPHPTTPRCKGSAGPGPARPRTRPGRPCSNATPKAVRPGSASSTAPATCWPT